jgi:hypothetical protein
MAAVLHLNNAMANYYVRVDDFPISPDSCLDVLPVRKDLERRLQPAGGGDAAITGDFVVPPPESAV